MIGRDRVVALEILPHTCSGALAHAVDRPTRGLEHLAGADHDLTTDQERR